MVNDKTLFENKWITVKERELPNGIKWVFGHHAWCNGAGVAILPFRREITNPAWNYSELRFLGRVEICPAHSSEPELTAVAGGMDKAGETPIEVAVRELYEETGYMAEISDMIPLGDCRPSKGTDTVMHLFAVDVSELPHVRPVGDGSLIEQLASNKWINRNEAAFCKDPMIAAMVGRLEIYLRG